MKKPWTVRCGHTARFAKTLIVEAETIEEALEKAVETAKTDDDRRPPGGCSRIFVDAVCEGVHTDPGDPDAAWPVPDRFTERGEPPVLTLTDPRRAEAQSKFPGDGFSSASRTLRPRSRVSLPIRPIRPATSRS